MDWPVEEAFYDALTPSMWCINCLYGTRGRGGRPNHGDQRHVGGTRTSHDTVAGDSETTLTCFCPHGSMPTVSFVESSPAGRGEVVGVVHADN
ncbi:hypothetical protein EEB19_08730 [Gordonia sp. OPL2]|nr:hypothetical protein EEB19_08730 [Gordonia sp. OPL2]